MDLDIKYRPRVFEEFCGNENVVRLITRYLTEDKLPNVIIFSGLSGSGKTSLAYLTIKSLLCNNHKDSKSADSCNKCDYCQALNESLYTRGVPSSGLNIHTFDMSLYGDESEYIKNVCNVIDSPILATKKRIVLLEELHITQPYLQEKLDRVLEFIKPNVYVFICTTNIKRIVTPIQRRSTILTLTIPPKEAQLRRLANIAISEGRPQSQEMLKKILEVSKNNPAKAVKNLGIILNAPEEGIKILFEEQEKKYDLFIEYFDSISMGIIGIIEYIENKVINPANFLIGLQDFIYSTLKLRYYTQAVATPNFRKKIKTSMSKFTDKVLVDILDSLSNIDYCTDNDAKRRLLLIGYKTNPHLYESINSTDTLNAIMYKNNDDKKEVKSDNHYGITKFTESYDKAMGVTSINDL